MEIKGEIAFLYFPTRDRPIFVQNTRFDRLLFCADWKPIVLFFFTLYPSHPAGDCIPSARSICRRTPAARSSYLPPRRISPAMAGFMSELSSGQLGADRLLLGPAHTGSFTIFILHFCNFRWIFFILPAPFSSTRQLPRPTQKSGGKPRSPTASYGHLQIFWRYATPTRRQPSCSAQRSQSGFFRQTSMQCSKISQ